MSGLPKGELFQLEFLPTNVLTSPIAATAGVPTTFAATDTNPTVRFDLPAMNDKAITDMILSVRYCVGNKTNPTPASTIAATGLVKPTAALGAHALIQSATLMNNNGFTLALEWDLPVVALQQNISRQNYPAYTSDIGNRIQPSRTGVVDTTFSNISDAVYNWVAFQPRLHLPDVLPLSLPGNLQLELMLPLPKQTFCFPMGVNNLLTDFPPTTYTNAQLWSVVTEDVSYNTDNQSGYPMPFIFGTADYLSNNMDDYTLFMEITLRVLYIEMPKAASQLEFVQRTQMIQYMPANGDIIQCSTPIVGQTLTDLEVRLADTRVWQNSTENNLSTCATVGTYTTFEINSRRLTQRYPTYSSQPPLNESYTVSTGDLQILQYDYREFAFLSRALRGECVRYFFSSEGQYLANIMLTLRRNLSTWPGYYLMPDTLTYARGTQGVTYVTPTGILPVTLITAVGFERNGAEWAALPGSLFTAPELIPPRDRFLGNSVAYELYYWSQNQQILQLPLLTPYWTLARYTISPVPSRLKLTSESYKSWTMTQTSTSVSAFVPKQPSSRSYYNFQHGGRQALTGTSILRTVQGQPVEPQFAGNVAYAFNLPDSGFISSMNLTMTLASLAPSDTLADFTAFVPTNDTAAGRVGYGALGTSGLFAGFTLRDERSTVFEADFNIQKTFDMLSYTHEERVEHHANYMSTDCFSRKQYVDEKYTPMLTCAKYNSILPASNCLYHYTGPSALSSIVRLNPGLTDCDTSCNGKLLTVSLDGCSSLLDQYKQCPQWPGRQLVVEIDQTGKYLFYPSAGGGAWNCLQYDPSLERFLFDTVVTANVAAHPPTQVQPALLINTSQPVMLQFRLGMMRDQSKVAKSMLSGGGFEMVLPHVYTNAEYLRMSADNAEPFPYTSVSSNSTFFTQATESLAFQPDALVIQTVQGYFDARRQNPPVFPATIPRYAASDGACAYSVPFLVKRNMSAATMTLSAPFPRVPYMQPTVDGSSLRPVLNTFGAPFDNAIEYWSLTGARVREPHGQWVPLSSNCKDILHPAIYRKTYDVTSPIAATAAVILPWNFRGIVATDACGLPCLKWPSTRFYSVINLRSLMKGRNLFSYNWKVDGQPMSLASLSNSVGDITQFYNASTSVINSEYLADGTTPNNVTAALWGAYSWSLTDTMTKFSHFFSTRRYRLTLEGISQL